MMNNEIQKQIDLMKSYAQMMLDRGDWHGLWDAAIDLQRLTDKLNPSNSGVLKIEEKYKCDVNCDYCANILRKIKNDR